MRGRGISWAVVAGLVVGTATLSVAASPSLQVPARVADRAQRLSPTHEHDVSPEARAIAEMVGLVNRVRAERGLPPLTLDARASAAARAHAADMAAMGRMQHAGSDGSDGGIRLERAGFAWSAWGENVAAGFLDPAALLSAWMNSSVHRANLLGDFTEVGVGVVATVDGVPYWSLLVARAA